MYSESDLLNEVNRWLEIKAEVNKLPVDALASVLVLFQDEHRVVEQLLKLLICVVDAQLLERVELQHSQLQQPFNTTIHINFNCSISRQLVCCTLMAQQ